MTDKPKKKTFAWNIEFDGDFTLAHLWPDNDAPENPTLDDVIKLIQRCGGPSCVAKDWNLIDDVTITISDETGMRCITGLGSGRVISSHDVPRCTKCGGPTHADMSTCSVP